MKRRSQKLISSIYTSSLMKKEFNHLNLTLTSSEMKRAFLAVLLD
jgi:hypothetical protein